MTDQEYRNYLDKKILVVGHTRDLGLAIVNKLTSLGFKVTGVSRATGHALSSVEQWYTQFLDYDIIINNAYDRMWQGELLRLFYEQWQHDASKQIITIGSSAADYVRYEKQKDHEFWAYRMYKQALNEACKKMVSSPCVAQIVNFGTIADTAMSHHRITTLSKEECADVVLQMIHNKKLRRVDYF